MKSFINKNDDEFLIEMWDSLKKLYAIVKENKHLNYVRKVPIGYHIDVNIDIPGFSIIKNLKNYFNHSKYNQGMSYLEIKKPGWSKHLDGTSTEPNKIYTGSCVWPIENYGLDNITSWYKQTKGDYIFNNHDSSGQINGGYWEFTEDSEFDLIDETCVNVPHIIRTDIPHSVNAPESTRVVCSYKLGTTDQISWEDVYKKYE